MSRLRFLINRRFEHQILALMLASLLALAPWPHLRALVLTFLIGAMTHAVVDIVSHVSDGPLPLWPLDRSLRLTGWFSHWEPAYGGLWISAVELLGAGVIGILWLFRYHRGKRQAREFASLTP